MQPQNTTSIHPWISFAKGTLTSAIFLGAVVGAFAFFGPSMVLSASDFALPAQTASVAPALALDVGRTGTMTVFDASGDVVVLDDWNYTGIVRGRPQPSQSK